MIDIDDLDERFSIEGELGFTEIDGGLVAISIYNKFADAEICLYGAQVTRFTPHGSFDLLWMSPTSFFEEGKAIRGGIPLCFPWFGPDPSGEGKPAHGFARLMYWDVVETAAKDTGETAIKLQLCSSTETKKYWPYEFSAELDIMVGKELDVKLTITNTDKQPFNYSAALHSYFNISGLENIKIEGLEGTSFYSGFGEDLFKQEEQMLEICQEENRRYIETESDCVIHDEVFSQAIRISKLGSKVTVVWNPGEETSSKMEDIAEGSFETFVCVEAVNFYNNTIQLNAGDKHTTGTTIGLDYGLKDLKPGAAGSSGFNIV
jgi:glucose-6-phosphate 1-epimerase